MPWLAAIRRFRTGSTEHGLLPGASLGIDIPDREQRRPLGHGGRFNPQGLKCPFGAIILGKRVQFLAAMP
jgi:hypothetical protein